MERPNLPDGHPGNDPPDLGPFIGWGIFVQVIPVPVIAGIIYTVKDMGRGLYNPHLPFGPTYLPIALTVLVVTIVWAVGKRVGYAIDRSTWQTKFAQYQVAYAEYEAWVKDQEARQERHRAAAAARAEQERQRHLAEEQMKAGARAYTAASAKAHDRFLMALARYRAAADFDGELSFEQLRAGFIGAYLNRLEPAELAMLYHSAQDDPSGADVLLRWLPARPTLPASTPSKRPA